MLFDNFNTCVSCTKHLHLEITNWPSDSYNNLQNTRIFCPSDFRNDFRRHSRDSKRPQNWLYPFLTLTRTLTLTPRCEQRICSVVISTRVSQFPYPLRLSLQLSLRFPLKSSPYKNRAKLIRFFFRAEKWWKILTQKNSPNRIGTAPRTAKFC